MRITSSKASAASGGEGALIERVRARHGLQRPGIGLAEGPPCSIASKRGRGMTQKVSLMDDTRGGFASLAGCARCCCSHRYKAVFSGAVARMGGEPTTEITVRARTRLTSWRAKGVRDTSMTPSARARATRRFVSPTLRPITFAKRPANGSTLTSRSDCRGRSSGHQVREIRRSGRADRCSRAPGLARLSVSRARVLRLARCSRAAWRRSSRRRRPNAA
jgi:hypothetical protein